MSLLWVRRINVSGSAIDDKGQQSFHTSYVAKSNKPRESRNLILLSGQIPQYGSTHAENPRAVCISVKVDQDKENPFLWHIDCEWKVNPQSKKDPADQQKQPDERRPKWSCKFVEIPCYRFVDLDGKPLRSTAGQPFDPVPDIPIIADEITIQRYEPECHRGTQRDFMDKANFDEWFGAEQGTAYLADISVQDEYLQGKYWYLTTYRLLIKPRIEITLPLGKKQLIGGFDPEYVANLGTLAYQWIGGEMKLAPILRTDPVNPDKKWYDGRPAYLDESGMELPRDPTSGIYTVDPLFLEFHMKAQVDFAPLKLIPPPGMSGD